MGFITPLAATLASGDACAPNASFARIDLTTNAAYSNYNALQAQYQRRLSRGLQVIASYTFAKSLDTVSDEVQGNLQSPTGKFGASQDRGASSFDVRHAFNSAVSYDIPSLFKSGIGRTIFGGFGLDTIVRGRTATPVNVVSGVNRFNLGVTTILRPDYIQGQPLYINDPNAAGVAQLLQSLKVSTDGSAVNMTVSIPEAQVESLIQLAGNAPAPKVGETISVLLIEVPAL